MLNDEQCKDSAVIRKVGGVRVDACQSGIVKHLLYWLATLNLAQNWIALSAKRSY